MKLSLSLLGEFSTSLGNHRLEIKSRKGQALLAFLALSPGGVARREILKALFWGDVDEKKAQSSLRYAMWSLNEILKPAGFVGLDSNRHQVLLDPDSIDLDISNVFESISSGKPDQRLLDDESLIDTLLVSLEDVSAEYGHWVTSKRAQLQGSVLSTLTAMIHAEPERAAHDSTDLLPAATLLNRLEPLNEIACQVLMRSRAGQGDSAGALAVYQNLCSEMDQQQGMDPSEATRNLAVAIKTGQIAPRTSVPVSQSNLGISDKPGVLLSAIEVIDTEGPRPHLFEGFRRELLASLIQFREWRIFDDRSESAGDLVTETAQTYKLELSATARQDDMRLVFTLMDARSGSYIWSDKVEGQIEGFLSSQADIVRKLAMAMNIGISNERLTNLASRSDFPLEVYDRWLFAQQHIDSMTPAGWETASSVLDELIADQESFARAHSARAEMETFRQLSFPGIISTDDQREKALIHARRSVTLDPQDTRNQLSLGWARAMDGQFKGAKMAFEQAHQLNENDPWTSISVAMGLAFCGDRDRAKALATEADTLNQRPTRLHWSYHAAIAFLLNDVHGCIHYSELAEECTVDVLAWHTAALQHSGQTLQAKATASRFLDLAAENWNAETEPTPTEIANWLLRAFPIRNRTDWQRLRAGLEMAGIAIGDVPPPVGSV